MNDLATEYGTALFSLAVEEGKQKEYAEALSALAQAFTEQPQYVELLSTPSVALSERLALLDEGFANLLPSAILSYLKLLCEKGRAACFLPSIEVYQALLDASERILRVKITSAVPLTEEQKRKLVAKLEKTEHCQVQAEYELDESLLGGVVVESEGKIVDGSVRRRLQEMKEVMNA